MTVAGSYAVFAVGAACVFVVVVVVAVVLQLASRIGEQLGDVTRALRAIDVDVAAIPAVAGINQDCREMNAVLSGVREDMERLLRRTGP